MRTVPSRVSSSLIVLAIAIGAVACSQGGPVLVATQLPTAPPGSTPSPTPTPIVQGVGTPTPPASSPDPTIDLNGLWIDNGREVQIVQSGDQVVATYVETYLCDHSDGTGATSETVHDFSGVLSGRVVSGETNTCIYGNTPYPAGLRLAPFTLTVSADGREMTGTWYSVVDEGDVPITITRVD